MKSDSSEVRIRVSSWVSFIHYSLRPRSKICRWILSGSLLSYSFTSNLYTSGLYSAQVWTGQSLLQFDITTGIWTGHVSSFQRAAAALISSWKRSYSFTITQHVSSCFDACPKSCLNRDFPFSLLSHQRLCWAHERRTHCTCSDTKPTDHSSVSFYTISGSDQSQWNKWNMQSVITMMNNTVITMWPNTFRCPLVGVKETHDSRLESTVHSEVLCCKKTTSLEPKQRGTMRISGVD